MTAVPVYSDLRQDVEGLLDPALGRSLGDLGRRWEARAFARDRGSDHRDQSADPVLMETLFRYQLHCAWAPVFAALGEALRGAARSLSSFYETAVLAPERRQRMRRQYGARRGHRRK